MEEKQFSCGGKRNVWISTPEIQVDLIQYSIFISSYQNRNISRYKEMWGSSLVTSGSRLCFLLFCLWPPTIDHFSPKYEVAEVRISTFKSEAKLLSRKKRWSAFSGSGRGSWPKWRSTVVSFSLVREAWSRKADYLLRWRKSWARKAKLSLYRWIVIPTLTYGPTFG